MELAVNDGLVSRTATDDWEEALITGNGRQGALFYGGPSAVRLTLSHERLFLPVTAALPPPHTAPIVPELRALLAEGRAAEASERVCALATAADPGYARTRWIDPLIGAATLTFVPVPDHTPIGGYERSADFATGVVTQRWGGVRCEAFASRAHDVIVLRVTGCSGTLTLAPIDGTPERPIRFEVTDTGDTLTLRARFPGAGDGDPDGYRVVCRVRRDGDGVTVVARTTVGDGASASDPADGPGAHGVPLDDFDLLLAAHREVHGELYHRFRLDLAGAAAERAADTEALLAAARRTGTASPAVTERLVAACRYAAISGVGELPPTLQGVWAGSFAPPWRSGFTLDGNLPAAVAGLAPTGTPELLLPVLDLIDAVRDDLRENARQLYGARGVLAPAHLSTHGRQNHFGPVWCLTFWTAGAAWLGRIMLEHWRHTGDEATLRARTLPFLAEVADFYLDFVEVADGRARFAPSYSPENASPHTGSQACVDATMDVAAAGDVLRALLELAGDDPRAGDWRRLLAALPPYRIAPTGELAEWIDPAAGERHAHRHASHLYPLWYEGDPAFDASPALREAAARAVRARLAWWDGADSDEMAYGLAQLGIAAAHLGLAEEAHRALSRIAARYVRPSLVPTHNRDAILNVDVAGGLPALVAAMLIRSRPGRLDLLPALPAAWTRGTVTGLIARGPVHVRRLSWAPGSVEAVLSAPSAGPVRVGLPDGSTHHIRLTAQDRLFTSDLSC